MKSVLTTEDVLNTISLRHAVTQFGIATQYECDVAADWLDEHGDEIGADWLRSERVLPPLLNENGHDYGRGYGSGDGSGDGDGHGNSSGYGSGYGTGDGNGYGDDGNGNGNGNGYGNGYGDGSGYGTGTGNGTGTGAGFGYIDKKHPKSQLLKESDMPNNGDYCLFRSREQGVVIGELAGGYGRTRTVKHARQLYAWESNSLTLFDVALNGPEKSQCRLSNEIGEIDMLEVCGIIRIDGEKLIKEFREYESR